MKWTFAILSLILVVALVDCCLARYDQWYKDQRKPATDVEARLDALEAEMRWRYRVLTEAIAETYGVEDRAYYAQALEEFAKNRGRWEACLAKNIRFAMEFKEWKEKNDRWNNREGEERK